MDLAAIDHVLTTTRSVRKRLDLTRPVEPEVIQRCIEIALQAPTGSNLQGWRFMVVTDPGKRAALAQIYGKARQTYYEMQADQPPQLPAGDLRAAQRARVSESSLYLGEHLHEVPVHIIPCIEGRMEEAPHLSQLTEYGTAYHAAIYGSIYPATWSLMLALRARGAGLRLDVPPSHVREGSRRNTGSPRQHHPGGPAARCLLQGHGFQACQADSRTRADLLGHLGATTELD